MSKEQKKVEDAIRSVVRKKLDEKIKNRINLINEKKTEKELRFFVRSRLLEAKKNPIPHDNTGANLLEETLRKVVPIIKDAFFTLTSDVNQRRSYRAHIINAFRSALSPYRTMQGYNKMSSDIDASEEEYGLMAGPMTEDDEIELDPNYQDAQPAQDQRSYLKNKFIEVEPEKQKEKEAEIKAAKVNPEDQERDKFTIDGEDVTGRNLALVSFKKIEKTIADDYSMLSLPRDRETFYEYGIINLKLYFDRWEKELHQTVNNGVGGEM